jgi:hypothetical protein
MAPYRFSVGQNVRLMQGAIHRGKSIYCEVVQIMPFDGASFQYRVRAADEQFDRIAKEHELAEVAEGEMEPATPSERFDKITSISIRKGKR